MFLNCVFVMLLKEQEKNNFASLVCLIRFVPLASFALESISLLITHLGPLECSRSPLLSPRQGQRQVNGIKVDGRQNTK